MIVNNINNSITSNINYLKNLGSGGINMDDKLIGNKKNILFYNDEEGNTKVEVLLENEDVWLNS